MRQKKEGDDTMNCLRVSEVAAILQTTETTIYQMIAEGKISAFKLRRSWRISRDSLSRLMNSKA
jgi:excisionase family DNA binding protein